MFAVKRVAVGWLCLGLLSCCSSAQAQKNDGAAAPVRSEGSVDAATDNPRQSVHMGEVRLGSGDLLEISVYGVPDLSQQVRVSANGDVSLALIGKVHVAGLSPEKAQGLIEQELRDGGFLRNPHVSLFVKEYATQGISVMGEVMKPGIYPLMGPRRLYDAIAAAGGLGPKAGRLVTISRRDDPQHPITLDFANDPARSLDNNVEVAPGDTVVVSRAGLVYVVGDVGQPGGFVMENNENVSVLQAVALARGVNRTAALGSSKIIRKTPAGYKEIPIPLDKILSAKMPDIALQNNDIVFVPGSAAKGAARRGLESIIAVATGVAIYRR